MKAEQAELARAIGLGLVALFGAVELTVWAMAPEEKTREEKVELLVDNLDAMYYFDAEIMAKKFYTNPSFRWSRNGLDPDTDCRYVGHGIWYAYGIVTDESTASPQRYWWKVYFRGEEQIPLYIEVAYRSWGDKSFARWREGHPNPAAPGLQR